MRAQTFGTPMTADATPILADESNENVIRAHGQRSPRFTLVSLSLLSAAIGVASAAIGVPRLNSECCE